jgi:acyl-CoA thioesterase FadM
MVFEREGLVRLSHTDAAGVIFFPRLLEMAQESWEDFLAANGLALAHGLEGPRPLLPIVHCEADYRRPMRLGDRFRAQLSLARAGRSSLGLRHRFLAPDGTLLAEALTIHVAMERRSGQPVPLSDDLRGLLERLRTDETADGRG